MKKSQNRDTSHDDSDYSSKCRHTLKGGKQSAEETQTADTLLYPDVLYFYTWLSRLRTHTKSNTFCHIGTVTDE